MVEVQKYEYYETNMFYSWSEDRNRKRNCVSDRSDTSTTFLTNLSENTSKTYNDEKVCNKCQRCGDLACDGCKTNDKVTKIGDPQRLSRNHSEKSGERSASREFLDHSGCETGEKEDKKKVIIGGPPLSKGCHCQDLTPEQKEQNVKPPPCTCDPKKANKLKRDKDKPKECPECDRIKLNANLIRAIQRINQLQAQRKLTEVEVKNILEEEYHGDIFGYRDDKKTKPVDADKKTVDEQPEKNIEEREQEMRAEFKEIIENEVTKFEEKKKKKAIKVITPKAPEKVEEETKKPKKKKKKKAEVSAVDMNEVLKWMYPNHHFGHKNCIPPFKEVPKTMGWLWNSSKGAGVLKPGRGWVPGAIRRDVLEVMKENRKDRRVVDDEEERTVARSSQRSGTSRNRDNQRGYAEKYNPTFHMHKKNGYYYFSLYPVKTDEYDKGGFDPKPAMFKVSATQPDPDNSDVTSTDDESYEIEFVTPTAMKKQIKKPIKRNISQQYVEDDYTAKKKTAPVVEEKKERESTKRASTTKKKGGKKKEGAKNKNK